MKRTFASNNVSQNNFKDQESDRVLPIGIVFMLVGLMVSMLCAQNNQKKEDKMGNF